MLDQKHSLQAKTKKKMLSDRCYEWVRLSLRFVSVVGVKVFAFADKYRGAYSSSLRRAVCPFYCDVNGYQVSSPLSPSRWICRNKSEPLD